MSVISCVLIGSGTQLIECGRRIVERGWAIVAVVSGDKKVGDWATGAGIEVRSSIAGAEEFLARSEFDYLFSIVNHAVIPERVLAMPRRAAVNFHDSLLPEYAGFNATAWAILEGRTTHGITWHLMSSKVDSGEVLKQVSFDIREDDTAFTLATQCQEAGIRSFSDLIDELSSGTTKPTPQTGTGSFHFKYDRPPAASLLPWGESAATLDRFVRALTYVSQDNPLGLPKVKVGEKYLCVSELSWGPESSLVSGEIAEVRGGEVFVGTGRRLVVLSGLTRLTGEDLSEEELSVEFGVVAGAAFSSPEASVREEITRFDEKVRKKELFWKKRLLHAEYPRLVGLQEPSKERKLEEDSLEVLPLDLSPSIPPEDRFAFGVALLAAHLARATHAETICLGYDHGGVPAAVQPLYEQILPLSLSVDLSSPFEALLTGVKQELARSEEAGSFQRDIWARYEDLRKRAASQRRAPISLIRRAEGGVISSLGEASLGLVDVGAGDVRLIFQPRAADPDFRTRFARHLSTLAKAALGNPTVALGQLDILSDEERRSVLVDWQDTRRDFAHDLCIHQLFEEQVVRSPERTALVFRDEELTYSELNSLADRAARGLRQRGVEAEKLVGICMNRSLDMVVGLLAILKAGGAYVPLDPAYPSQRLALMMKDSGAEFVLTNHATASQVPKGGAEPLLLEALIQADPTNLAPGREATPDNLAYVIFTSGSTGRPKGVMVSHRNVSNFFTGMDEVIGTDPGVWLAVTSISFDISVLEIFWTLCRGFEVVLQEEADRGSFRREPRLTSQSARPMGFGLFYFSADAEGEGYFESGRNRYRLMLEGAKFADENGFAAVWTPERHFHAFGGLYPNPAVTSAALAATTSRVQIRAGSVVLPLHDPIRVAEDWSVIDNLSGGRVGLSFASGWHANDFVLSPGNYAERRTVMQEYIATVRSLWRGESITRVNGEGASIEVKILPRPVQPDPPLWIASAGNVGTFRAAGELGTNVLTNMLGQSIEDLREKLAAYRAAWKEAGHAGEGIVSVMLHTYVGADFEEAKRVVKKPFCNYLSSSFDLVKAAPWMFPAFRQPSKKAAEDQALDPSSFTPEDIEALMEHAFERYFETAGLLGTPSSCLKMIDDLKSIGADEVACLIDFGVDEDLVLQSLEHLQELHERSNAAPEQAEESGSTRSYSIAEQIQRRGVTHMQCTPSLLRILGVDDAKFASISSLKKLLLGGEALPPDLVERLSGNVFCEILNMYGPTETTIWSTCARVKQGEPITIGRPIANTFIRILDENGGLVPPGTPGELCIGGAGVARGYLNRPDLTDERFVRDRYSPGSEGRIYRTGDLARYRTDGAIEFLGRLDHQIKLNGYRIELGEVEAALCRHPTVEQAVLVAEVSEMGGGSLLAYVVPRKQGDSGEEEPPGWQNIWEETYKEASEGSPRERRDARFNTAGWSSSFSGAPVPEAEMRQWVENTVERILELAPRRIVEIGCGTGMLLFRCLEKVEHYTGVDFSQSALDHIRAELSADEAKKVTLLCEQADQLSSLPRGSADLVVINSVAQYFPSAEYLEKVLNSAADWVSDGGAILIGDVRSLPLLPAFHTAIELEHAPLDLTLEELAGRIESRGKREGELVLSPEFFYGLAARHSRLCGAEVHLKRGTFDNEMTRYRYDVIFRVGRAEEAVDVSSLEVVRGIDDLESLKERLSSVPMALALTDVLNQRLSGNVAVTQTLAMKSGGTVSALREMASEARGVHPEDLHALSDYHVKVTWAASGAQDRMDAYLFHRDKWPGSRTLPTPQMVERGPTFNTPARGSSGSPALDIELREFLRESLPEYMIPASLIVLDEVPLTPNGKIDRARLPSPRDTNLVTAAAAYVPPADEVEESIAEIWQTLLGVPRIGREENLFDLGANSLLTVQARNNISKTLGRDVSLVSMFRYPTVMALARHLGEGQGSAKVEKAVDDRKLRRQDAMERRRAAREGRNNPRGSN